jgi:hypothetical protein
MRSQQLRLLSSFGGLTFRISSFLHTESHFVSEKHLFQITISGLVFCNMKVFGFLHKDFFSQDLVEYNLHKNRMAP